MLKRSIIFIAAVLCIFAVGGAAAFADEVEYTPDMSGSEAENWECSEGVTLAGGILTNSWTNSTTMNVTAVEDVYSFKGSYSFNAKVGNEGANNANAVLMVFNYTNDRNFYFVRIGGDGEIAFGKRISGNDTLIEKYPEKHKLSTSAGITVSVSEEKAAVTLTGKENIVMFKDMSVAAIPSGKVGFKTINSVMKISEISVAGEADKCLLGLSSSSIADGETGVAFYPEPELIFDLQLDADTVSKSNIYLQCGDQPADSALYELNFDGDKKVTLRFNDSLIPKTKYTIVIGSGLHSLEYGSGFAKNYTISFTTKAEIFEVTTAQVLVKGSEITDLSGHGGQSAILRIKARNNEMSDPQPYAVTFAIFDVNNKLTASKTFSGEAALGTDVSGTSSIVIPEGLSVGAYYKWYVWDSLSNDKILHHTVPMNFEMTEFAAVDVDIANGRINISGVLPNKLAKRDLTLLVTNPVQNAEAAKTIQNIAECVTGDGGAFSYSFEISGQAGGVSGTYDITVSGDDFSEPLRLTCYFALKSDRLNAIGDINSGAESAEAMRIKLDKYKEILGYNVDSYNKIDTLRLAERVLEYLKSAQFDAENESFVQEFMRRESLLEAWEQSVREVAADDNKNINYPQLLGLDTLDADKKVKAFGFYNNSLTAAGKQLVIKALLGKSFASAEDFRKSFAEYVTIYGVTECNADGYGHIKDLLNTNADYTGLDLSDYVPSLADRQLVSKTINSLSELQGYINSLSKSVKKDSGGGGSSSGGGGSSHVSAVKPSIGHVSVPEIEAPVKEAIDKATSADIFTDIDNFGWAREAIEKLAGMKVISAQDNKRFRPTDNITRQEFVKLIVTALAIEPKDGESIFTDVASWAVPYVNAAYNKGIVNGIDKENFGGENSITRQDAVAVIARAFGLMNGSTKTQYADADTIADYAADAVAITTEKGIISGYDSKFHPLDNCTRAQAAVIIYNAVTLSGKSTDIKGVTE